jgi:hypothetical protein
MLFEQQLSRIEHRLVAVEQKEDAIMAGQASIDAAVAALTPFLTDLSNDVAAIKAQLAAGGTPVNTDALDAVVAQLPAAQAALDALANPTPPPASASAVSGAFRPTL